MHRKETKVVFLGHFSLSKGHTYLRTLIVNKVLGSFKEESINFIQPAVREIWILGNFRVLRHNFDPPKIGFAHLSADHIVNSKNRPSKDSKTVPVSEPGIIGQLSSFLE